MANCTYCGRPAGLLRRVHRECESKHKAGWEQMVQCVRIAIPAETPADQLQCQLLAIARDSFVSSSRIPEALTLGWEQTASHFLEDGNLDEQEEAYLLDFVSRSGLDRKDIDSNGLHTQVVQAAAVRETLEGQVTTRCKVVGQLPFNFQKSESVIWVFLNTAYYEDKTRRQYVGGSHGFSVRLAKGLYYRVGAFRGHPVDTTHTLHVDTGVLAITNKHVYFAGPSKSFRVRHDKIVSYIPYSDGFGIYRDATTAKQQTFVTGNGWFAYNLVANASGVADTPTTGAPARRTRKGT